MFRSLKSKIIIPLIALLIFLVLVIVTIASTSTRNLSNTLTDERIAGVSQAARSHLNSLEQHSLLAAQAVANSSTFVEYLQDGDRDSMFLYLTLRRTLFNIDNFVVVDSMGSIIMRTHSHADYGDSLEDFPGISSAMQGVAITIYAPNPTSYLSLTSAVPVFDSEHQVIGVLLAVVDMTTDRFIYEFAQTFNAEVAIYSDYTVRATTIKNEDGQRVVGDLAPIEVIEEVLAHKAAYPFVLHLNGIEHHAMYFPLYARPDEPPTGMFFIGFSNEDTLASTAQMQQLLITIGVFIAIIGSLLMFILLVQLLRPLAKLNQSVSQITDPAADSVHIYGRARSDEVGVLSRTIEQMCNTIRANAVIESAMTKELEVALGKAQAANTAKGNFLSNMSHEIRTPINAITGMVAIGKAAHRLDKKDYTLEKIDGACVHLLGIVNDILDMSKIEANKFELSPADFQFSHLITRVVDINMFKANEKNQELTIIISEDIPELLYGDEHRLGQVLTNLISNAVKFTPDSGKVSLETRLFEQPKYTPDEIITVLFEVTDNGIGISEEQKARLFDAFEQAENNTSRKYGGTGLGLTISKHIVEMMGGKIWIESQLGKGAKFSFTVPLQRSYLDQPNSADTSDSDSVTVNFDGRRILLCEDIDINREIVMALLEGFGLQIDYAENGIEAIEMFSASPDNYDIILMDLQMPLMDGLEATRQIRKLPFVNSKTIPIVAMTANVFKEDVERCLAAGMNDHIGKPIDFDILLSKLKKYLH